MTSRRTPEQLRRDAVAIWHAAVDAVASDRLVRENVIVEGETLRIADDVVPLAQVHRICVVGAGKAGAGMAAGLESALGETVLRQKQVSGWVNVPADCVRPLSRVTVHAARPAGVNEPTVEGVRGSEKILAHGRISHAARSVHLLALGRRFRAVARTRSRHFTGRETRRDAAFKRSRCQHPTTQYGAQAVEQDQGWRPGQACRAGRLITLIISDVLGDPLDVIASGPTVANTTTASDALEVLRQFPASDRRVTEVVYRYLQHRCTTEPARSWPPTCRVSNVVIGNNAVAVDAAGLEAERRGYSHAMLASRTLEGEAEAVGIHLARMARQMRETPGPDCLITGGEPTVTLVDAAQRGLGGRNQQLVLAALLELTRGRNSQSPSDSMQGMLVLAGGTDGEDGPTDAAGALADHTLVEAARLLQSGWRRLPAAQRCLPLLCTVERPAQDRPHPHKRL